MASGFWFSMTLLLTILETVKCDPIPDGVVHMECRDRYFMIAVDRAFTWDEHSFEAVDRTGVYPITEQYAAKCGYTISAPLQGKVELRASYFSCHTANKDDEVFTFNFNLLIHEGQTTTYSLNKTCSPSLPWSPREITCEVNYMEVSVRSAVTCPSGTKDNWNSLKPAYDSTTSDWQVMFQRTGEQLPPITLSDARKQGYVFDLSDGRLVFRTPYGQPDSSNATVNGVPVEVVHAALFSRQSWVVLMVDLVAACSMAEASYDDSGYVIWETPEALYPNLHNAHVHVGLNGELVPQPSAEDRGYVVETDNGTVQISIPYNAEGGVRESFVNGDLHEYYIFNLYLEQLLVDEDYVETRLRLQRTLATPLLPRPVFTENQTMVEERMFTIYLGDVPEDVELSAVQLNDHDCTLPLPNTSIHTISEVVQPNNTRGYTLSVPFNDPVVIRQFSKEDAVMQYKLDVNFTLMVQPENKSFYHFTSIMALTDVSPPTFEAVCLESGISFRLDHQPSDYLWDIRIGSAPMTAELAAERGYIMTNDSQSLLLEVPLFTEGYEYKDFTLEGFFGTFEILVLDHETSEVQNSAVKTCRFRTSELIVCSKDGRMTVVVDLSLAASGGIPTRTNLANAYCGPNDVDGTRALFSFSLNSCGSTVRLNMGNVTYENEIIVSKRSLSLNKGGSDLIMQRVTVQCTYALAGLYRLFSVYKFESDIPGVGRIIHTTEGLPMPTAAIQTTAVTERPTRGRDLRQFKLQPNLHPSASHIRIKHFPRNMQKYAGGSSFNVKI